MEKAPTRAFSSLKVPRYLTSTFTLKTLLRHYAKRALTPRSLNVKLGLRCNYHEGWVAISVTTPLLEPSASWNNGKSGAKLDLTSSTTTGLQIHKFDHTRTANPFGWLPCRHAAFLLVGCPHSLVYLHLPVVEGLIFCISATPHLGTSFP